MAAIISKSYKVSVQEDIKEIEEKLKMPISIVEHLWDAEKFFENSERLQDLMSKGVAVEEINQTGVRDWKEYLCEHQYAYSEERYPPTLDYFNNNCHSVNAIKMDAFKCRLEKELCGRMILAEKKIIELLIVTLDLDMILKQQKEDNDFAQIKISQIQEQNTNDLNIVKEQHTLDLDILKKQYDNQVYLLNEKNLRLKERNFNLKGMNLKLEEMCKNNKIVLEQKLYNLEHNQYNIYIIIICLVIINIYLNLLW